MGSRLCVLARLVRNILNMDNEETKQCATPPTAIKQLHSGKCRDQVQAEDYLKKHKISDVLSILTSSLIHSRPFNSRRYMADYLENLKKVRDEYCNDRDKFVPHGPPHPLFSNSNLEALFKTADVVDSGKITAEVAARLARVLGIDEPEPLFEHCDNMVTMKFFQETVEEALLKNTASFYDVKEKYKTKLQKTIHTIFQLRQYL